MDPNLLNGLLAEIDGVGPVIELKPTKQPKAREAADTGTITSVNPTPPLEPTAVPPAPIAPAPKTYAEMVAEWKKQIAAAPRRYASPSGSGGDETNSSHDSRVEVSPQDQMSQKLKSIMDGSKRDVYERKGVTVEQHLPEVDEEDDKGNASDELLELELFGESGADEASPGDSSKAGNKRSRDVFDIENGEDSVEVVRLKKMKLSKPTAKKDAFSDGKLASGSQDAGAEEDRCEDEN